MPFTYNKNIIYFTEDYINQKMSMIMESLSFKK